MTEGLREKSVSMPFMKSILMLFNIAFWLSGLSIIWAGIWMQTDLQNYLKISTEYSKVVPYILVATGTVILFAATLACSCTVKGQPSLLYAYGGFLTIILFVELALAASIYSYKERLAEGFEDGLTQDIKSYATTPINARTINSIQEKLHCCGIHSYKDWKSLNPDLEIPLSCCIATKENCDPSNKNFLYPNGCYSKLMEILNSNMSLIAGFASGLAFFPLIGTILAWFLATNVKKSKYEPIIG